jgi:hypothetical protein
VRAGSQFSCETAEVCRGFIDREGEPIAGSYLIDLVERWRSDVSGSIGTRNLCDPGIWGRPDRVVVRPGSFGKRPRAYRDSTRSRYPTRHERRWGNYRLQGRLLGRGGRRAHRTQPSGSLRGAPNGSRKHSIEPEVETRFQGRKLLADDLQVTQGGLQGAED